MITDYRLYKYVYMSPQKFLSLAKQTGITTNRIVKETDDTYGGIVKYKNRLLKKEIIEPAILVYSSLKDIKTNQHPMWADGTHRAQAHVLLKRKRMKVKIMYLVGF